MSTSTARDPGGGGFTSVDGKPVLLADGDDSVGEPAAVAVGKPLGGVVVALLVPVHAGAREREIEQGSVAKRRRVALSAAHRPLSCASDRATMCSMSVSDLLANHWPV